MTETTKTTMAVDVDALVADAKSAVAEKTAEAAEAQAAAEAARAAEEALKERLANVEKLRGAKRRIKDVAGWHRDPDLKAKLEAIEQGIKALVKEGEENGEDIAGIVAFKERGDRAWALAKSDQVRFGDVQDLLNECVENKNARVLNLDSAADKATLEDETKKKAIVSIRFGAEEKFFFFEGAAQGKRGVQNLVGGIVAAKRQATRTARAQSEARSKIAARSGDANAAFDFKDGEYAIEIELPAREGRKRGTDGVLLIAVSNGKLTLEDVVRGFNGNLPAYMVDEETNEPLAGGSWSKGHLPRRLFLQLKFAGSPGDSPKPRDERTPSRKPRAEFSGPMGRASVKGDEGLKALRDELAVEAAEEIESEAPATDSDFSALEGLVEELKAKADPKVDENAVAALAKEFDATPKAAQLAVEHQADPAAFLAGITGTGKDGVITVADVKSASKKS